MGEGADLRVRRTTNNLAMDDQSEPGRHRMSSSSTVLERSVDAVPTAIPMLIGGAWRAASEDYEVRDPYRGTLVARAPRSSMSDLNDALDAAVQATRAAPGNPGLERAPRLGP